jgi:hypothetical protein
MAVKKHAAKKRCKKAFDRERFCFFFEMLLKSVLQKSTLKKQAV